MKYPMHSNAVREFLMFAPFEGVPKSITRWMFGRILCPVRLTITAGQPCVSAPNSESSLILLLNHKTTIQTSTISTEFQKDHIRLPYECHIEWNLHLDAQSSFCPLSAHPGAPSQVQLVWTTVLRSAVQAPPAICKSHEISRRNFSLFESTRKTATTLAILICYHGCLIPVWYYREVAMFRALRDCVWLWDVKTIDSPASMSLAISACQQMNKNALNILQWSLDRAIPGRRQNCAIPCEPMQSIKSKTRVTTHELHHYAMSWPNVIQSVQSNGSKGAISSKSNHQPCTMEFRGRAEIAGAKTIHWVIQQENLPAVHLQFCNKKERMSSLSVFLWLSFFDLVFACANLVILHAHQSLC